MKEVVGKMVSDIVTNENAQNTAGAALDLLFPYLGAHKRAFEQYCQNIQNSNLPDEDKVVALYDAKRRIKHMVNQKRIAKIAKENVHEDTDFSKNSDVDEEWLERFMESAKFVSNEQIQDIWGKLLAKEFEQPGTTPANMVRIMSEITPHYAQAFQKVCSMSVDIIYLDEQEHPEQIDTQIYVPYERNQKEMRSVGIDFVMLNELETLGLIKYSSTGYLLQDVSAKTVIYHCETGDITAQISSEKNIPIGNVMLTAAGQALRNITPSEEVPEFADWLKADISNTPYITICEDYEYQVQVMNTVISIKKISKEQPCSQTEN